MKSYFKEKVHCPSMELIIDLKEKKFMGFFVTQPLSIIIFWGEFNDNLNSPKFQKYGYLPGSSREMTLIETPEALQVLKK